MSLRRLARWTLWGFLGLTGLAVVAVAGGFAWLRTSLPQTEGVIELAGPRAPVDLFRDVNGLVTIRAESLIDAYFAVGFAHAQDRLWQMDFMRFTGAGRLSEVVGPKTLPLDRFMRGLGLYRVAEANLASLKPETRAAIDAYTAGVNAFIATHEGAWPPEYYLLRTAPEPWKPADSIVWGRLMAMQLSGNWRDEIRRARLSEHLSEAQIAFLWPDYPPDAPVAIGGLPGLERRSDRQPPRRLNEILPWAWYPKSASNSWALAGSETGSGKPILANDPHLGLTAPSVWYLVRIETPELTLAGATAPGVPFIVIGHNQHIAWGFTTTEGDTQDLFVERLSDGDPSRYDTPEGPKAFIEREEEIAIRDHPPEIMTVRKTRHGPVISDFLPEAAEIVGEDQVLALAWPALRDDDRTADAMADLNRARDWDGFLEAMRSLHSPQQTVIYADVEGRIGLIAPARVPMRPRGEGRLPVPGWSGDYDWSGFIPFDALPQIVDPPEGRIIAANNRLVPDAYPHLITAHWRNPYRAARIAELLDMTPKSTLDQHRRIQNDIVSRGARDLLPLLLAAPASDERSQKAQSLLRDWDYRMSRDRPEPLIFYAWIDALNRRLIGDELAASFEDFARPDIPLLVKLLSDGEAWCDDIGSDGAESCGQQIADALKEALDELTEAQGNDMTAWRWGAAHKAWFPHPLFSRIPLLRRLVDYSVETDGGNTTVSRGGATFTRDPRKRFSHVHGSGLRALFDLDDLDDSEFIIAIGQSGNPLSPHYGRFAEPWRDGLSLPLDGIGLQRDDRLRLLPKP